MDEMRLQDTDSMDMYSQSTHDEAGYMGDDQIRLLSQYAASDNIANDIDDGKLSQMGQDCVDGYKHDFDSLNDWRTMITQVLKLAKLEREEKSYPWPDAANIKYPLIVQANIQFAARAYPEIVQGTKVVRAQVIGDDPEGQKEKRAQRISEHMSWQILEQIDGWEESTDKLLNMLPLYGAMYRKIYYDAVQEKPAQVLLTPLECLVNANVRNHNDARRITQELYLYPNDVRERVNSGLWIDQPIGDANYSGKQDDGRDKRTADDDAAAMHLFLEQHCWYDLDDDGYAEPYIVTVHKDSGRVMRVVARYDQESIEIESDGAGRAKLIRIKPLEYFVKYTFIPSPDGRGIDMGFGALLCAANETVNSITNQLIDSGTTANMQSGFMSEAVGLSGVSPFAPGEWKKANVAPEDLSKAFFMLPSKEPSAVLFQLLSFTIQGFKEFAGNVDALSGGGANANTSPGTMLAQIEQGQKVYSSIYKRIYRAMRKEFRLLANINAKHLTREQYFRVLDSQEAMQVGPADYQSKDFDIVPVADPNQSTAVQRLAKAQALLAAKGLKGVDDYEVSKTYVDALQIDNPRIILAPERLPQPPPDPVMMEVQATAAYNAGRLRLAATELQMKASEYQSKAEKALAEAILALAKAETEQGQQALAELQHSLEVLKASFDMHTKNLETFGGLNGVIPGAREGENPLNGMAPPMPRPNIPQVPTQPVARPGNVGQFPM